LSLHVDQLDGIPLLAGRLQLPSCLHNCLQRWQLGHDRN